MTNLLGRVGYSSANERTESGEVLHNRNRNKRLAFYRYRDLSEVNLEAIPPELRKRQVIATLNIADHTARGNAPLHQNLIERTYLGRTEMMDLVNFREYVGSEHRIRAVANTRSQRWVVFALDLPISSSDFTELSQSNANIGLWFKIADLYILEDGLFLAENGPETVCLKLLKASITNVFYPSKTLLYVRNKVFRQLKSDSIHTHFKACGKCCP